MNAKFALKCKLIAILYDANEFVHKFINDLKQKLNYFSRIYSL